MSSRSLRAVDDFPQIWLKPMAAEGLADCEGIVFDIDGVLLEVSESFRLAISTTVQFYFNHILGWPSGAILITPEETQMFKMAGGFNNDWDLTDIVVFFYMAKSLKNPQYKTLDALRDAEPSLKEFTDRIKTAGGGVAAAKKASLAEISQAQGIKVEQDWDRRKIRRIFQEHYAGSRFCRRLYGFDPIYFNGQGLLEREHVLIDLNVLQPWQGRLGILTGRAREEAILAVEVTGLAGHISEDNVLFDDDGTLRKPNPEALLTLSERMGIAKGIYFGDTADDLMTVNNLKALNADVRFYSGVILHRESERAYFEEHGADLIATDINEALRFILRLKAEDDDG